ncbi:MAG: hypothetical protein HS132_04945 [Planctomycetia bacterium]|nr:hypothetical protein [Planctomycetia bacterium]
MNRLTIFLVLVVCMVCIGCKTTSTSVINIDIDIPSHDIKTLAVMRFDDKLIQDNAVTGVFIKTISNPDAGEMLATIMTNELLSWNIYKILTRSEVRDKIRIGRAKEVELVKRRDYTALGKILKADAVIIGKIHSFDLSRMPVYERGTVSFTAECLDTKNGRILWSVEANESASYKDEIELASKVIREVIEKLKKEME